MSGAGPPGEGAARPPVLRGACAGAQEEAPGAAGEGGGEARRRGGEAQAEAEGGEGEFEGEVRCLSSSGREVEGTGEEGFGYPRRGVEGGGEEGEGR